jgi:hypothetical protein
MPNTIVFLNFFSDRPFRVPRDSAAFQVSEKQPTNAVANYQRFVACQPFSWLK